MHVAFLTPCLQTCTLVNDINLKYPAKTNTLKDWYYLFYFKIDVTEEHVLLTALLCRLYFALQDAVQLICLYIFYFH